MKRKSLSKMIFCCNQDKMFRRKLHYKLSLDPEYEVLAFENFSTMLQQLHIQPEIITVDVDQIKENEYLLIDVIKERSPKTKIITLFTDENSETVEKLKNKNIFSYIQKNDNVLDELWRSAHIATNDLQVKHDSQPEIKKPHQYFNLLTDVKGTSEEMQKVFRLVNKTLNTKINVTISGETGTGKELIAKTIHYNSKLKNKPFVAINVAAIPNDLIESELFGHEKGAFTGASDSRIGQLEFAKGGTLFLDEIAEMSLQMQAKLLRVLQEMELIRLGSNKKVSLDFRLITSTHKNLLEEVKKGNFREDLYYRIVGVKINLPPLRRRGKDIVILANYFIEEFAKLNRINPKKLSFNAIKALSNYAFPGNIRELKAIVETALIMSEEEQIIESDLLLNTQENGGSDLSYEDGKTLEYYTIKIIQEALKKNQFNVIKTAKKLDIGKSKIYKLLQEGKLKKQSSTK